ncbi:MAG: hypothetical protein ACFNM7_11395, partial [Prevotella conceptionensis]
NSPPAATAVSPVRPPAAMPADIAKNTTHFAMGTDKDNHIWLVCAGTGKVWRVRKNSVGWATNK